jgi:hypothetical protein
VAGIPLGLKIKKIYSESVIDIALLVNQLLFKLYEFCFLQKMGIISEN